MGLPEHQVDNTCDQLVLVALVRERCLNGVFALLSFQPELNQPGRKNALSNLSEGGDVSSGSSSAQKRTRPKVKS